MKRIIAVLLALVFLVGVMSLAACGPDDTERPGSPGATPPGGDADTEGLWSWQLDTSPFEFDILFSGTWGTFYPWRGSYVEDWIREDTGVTMNIIIPTGSAEEFFNVLIAADDLPDALCYEWNNPSIQRLIEAGRIHSINELSAQYAPELMGMIDEDIINFHSQPNGNLYYLISFMPSAEEFAKAHEKANIRGFFIQTGVNEALGRPEVNTPDDFIELLRTIRDEFPDRRPLIIENSLDVMARGLHGGETLRFLSAVFAPETLGRQFFIEDGELRFLFESEGFVNAIGFLNQIFREGLISVDTLLLDDDRWGEELNSGNYAIAARFPIDIWRGHNPQIMLVTGDEGRTYEAMTPLFRVDGQMPQFAGNRGPGWVGNMVTTNATNPGRIIRFFQYAWQDYGQITNLFGREGITFYWGEDGLPHYLPEILEELAEDFDAWSDRWGIERRIMMWRPFWAGWQRVAIAPPEYAQFLEDTAVYAVDAWLMGIDDLLPDPTSREGVDYERIRMIWHQALNQMVFANSDEEFRAAYESAMIEIAEANLEGVRAVMFANHLDELARKGVR